MLSEVISVVLAAIVTAVADSSAANGVFGCDAASFKSSRNDSGALQS